MTRISRFCCPDANGSNIDRTVYLTRLRNLIQYSDTLVVSTVNLLWNTCHIDLSIWSAIRNHLFLIAINTIELVYGPFRKWASQHERISKVRMSSCCRDKMATHNELVAEISNVLEGFQRQIRPILGRIEMRYTTCDGGFDHGGLKAHDSIPSKGHYCIVSSIRFRIQKRA